MTDLAPLGAPSPSLFREGRDLPPRDAGEHSSGAHRAARTKELASMKDHRKFILRARISDISQRILDVAESTVMSLTAAPKIAPASKAVARRQAANMLEVWRVCALRTCRRTRCCRGEPADCLRYALPVLPPEMLRRLAGPHLRKRWRAAEAAR
jgi:hypothetical protein